MKSKKLLARLAEFLSADESTQRAEIDAINQILKALKLKENALKARLEEGDLDEGEATAIKTKLDVIYAQRHNGIERVRALRAAEFEIKGPRKGH